MIIITTMPLSYAARGVIYNMFMVQATVITIENYECNTFISNRSSSLSQDPFDDSSMDSTSLDLVSNL
jgi:hypothetical protein